MASEGDRFLQSTKYPPERKPDYGPVPGEPLDVVKLPTPAGAPEARLSDLLSARRSRRKFTGGSISLGDLGYLAWAADGVSEPDMPPLYRTAPSAGARHPLETYLLVNRVEGLEPGVYRYGVEGHELEQLRKGDFSEAAVTAAAGQEWVRSAAVVFVWTARFERTTSKYRDRGYRYVFLDAGHVGQNLYLAVESLGLGMTAIAALTDDEVNAIVGADGTEESVVYMAALGTISGE